MEPLTRSTPDGVPLRRPLEADPRGFASDPALPVERRVVAVVNASPLVAAAYDPLWRRRSVGLLTRGRYGGRRERDAMVAWLGLETDAAVLDVGCGSGYVLRALHDAQPAARLHGVDRSAAFLARGVARFGRDGLAASWLRGDAHDLPYADAVFDALVMAGTPNELREPDRAFREAARVLRPGGRAWFMASVRGDGGWARAGAAIAAWGGLWLPPANELVDRILAAGFRAARIEHRPPLLLGRFERAP